MNFQATSTEQGKQFEQLVRAWLKFQGWDVPNDRPEFVHGHEIDIVAVSPDGQEVLIECKGSWRGKDPGCRRSDTVKKAVGVAASLRAMGEERPYYLVTSHLPEGDVVARRMLDTAIEAGWFTRVVCLPPL